MSIKDANSQKGDDNQSEEEDDEMYFGIKNDKHEEAKKEVHQSIEALEPFKPLEKGKYFVEKTLLVISKFPFFEQFERILIDIQHSITKEGLMAPFEDYIARLVYQVPAPPRGIQNVRLKLISKTLPHKDVTVFQPPINRLPYADRNSINTLFECLNVDNVLLFFKRVLLDSNVSILSIVMEYMVRI